MPSRSATNRPSGRRVASKAAHDGGSVSKVALPVAIPSAQIAATCGQSASVISRNRTLLSHP